MFARILLPVDFSDRCLAAARYMIPWAEYFIPKSPCFICSRLAVISGPRNSADPWPLRLWPSGTIGPGITSTITSGRKWHT
jgi:hypothetical protein